MQAPAPQENVSASSPTKPGFVGSKTCRDCHEHFHELWVTSRHGLAMQPYTQELASKELQPQANDVVIGNRSFHAEIELKPGAGARTKPIG